MSITNLTGTIWVIKEVPDVVSFPFTWAGYITFIANGETFTSIERSGTTKLIFGSKTVYTVGGTNENWPNYRKISIISGKYGYDTSAKLISWLEANAELIESYYTNGLEIKSIADAIRAKGGTSETLEYPNGFVTAIEAIETGITPAGTLEIAENDTYDVATKASVHVNVKQWDTELKEILDGSATELSDLPSGLTKIKPYAFYHNARKLPDGYVQLESVYFGGNSVIETDIPYRAVPVVSISAKSDGQKSVSQVLYGYERGGNGGTYFGIMPNTSLWSLGSGLNFSNAFNRTDITVSNTVVSNTNYSISATIGGETKTRSGTAQGHFANVTIGGCINSQNAVAYPFYGYVYDDFQARIDGVLKYDYVPAKRTSDNKVGYYDVINDIFKLPFGSDLVGGAEIPTEDTKSIQTADLSVTEIGAFAFYNNELADLTLRANTVVTLGEHALEGTPIADGMGHVYVNADLVNAYKSDSAWSTYAGVIEARS